MPRLIIKPPKGETREVSVKESRVIIGRKSTDDIRLDDPKVSRSHAEIYYRDGKYFIRDLNSRNGTRVNDNPIDEYQLKYGDKILIGDTEIIFEESKEPITFQLRGYEIIEHIATGGMGKVYKGRQISLDRLVAIKVLSPSLAANDEFRERFIKEARAAGKLNHPNLVQVHDVDKEGDILYFAMEFVEGNSVKELIKREKIISPQQTVDIAIQTARALEYIHQNNVIHRDVKPDNIIIDREGNVKLADLGIAKRSDETKKDIDEGKIVGTPHYLSPEQAKGEHLDGRTDIYSLGATMYHMLTGQTPFKGSSSTEIVQQHLHKKVTPPIQINKNIPKELSDLVVRMMEKDPNLRPQSATEVLQELEKIKAKLQEEMKATEAKILGQPKYYIAAVIILGIAVLGIGATVTYILKEKSKEIQTSQDTTNPNTSNISQEETIKSMIEDCLEKEKQGNFEEALSGYKEIVSKFPDYEDISSIQDKIKTLEEQIQKQEEQRRLEKAQKEFASIEEFAKNNVLMYEEQKKKWEEFIKKYPDIKLASDAKERLIKIEDILRNKKVQEEFDKVKEEASKLVLMSKYKEACDVLEQFKEKFKDDNWQKKAEEEIKLIIDNAEKYYSEAIAKADAYKKNGDMANALSSYRHILQVIKGIESLEKGVQKKIDNLEKSLQKSYSELVKKAEAFVRKFKFSDGEAILQTNLVKFIGTEWEDKIKEKIEEIKQLDKLHSMVVEGANKKSNKKIKTNFKMNVFGEKRTGIFGKIDTERVEIKFTVFENEFAQTYPWEELGPEKAYIIYQTYLDERRKVIKEGLEIFRRVFGVDMSKVEKIKKGEE